MMAPTPIYLEVGKQRVFACALDWPGWCRAGKGEDAAMAALAASMPRYAAVAAAAGLRFPTDAGAAFDVVERVPGSATTDFGAPGTVAPGDRDPQSRREAERQAALVSASWTVLDGVVATAPAELRKGPRGGGRDRDQIFDHVLAAEAAYASKLDLKLRQPAANDRSAISAFRDALFAVLRAPSGSKPAAEKGWPARLAARRIAWHALDHAWEIEDRSEPAP
jgi:hypothetical protein